MAFSDQCPAQVTQEKLVIFFLTHAHSFLSFTQGEDSEDFKSTGFSSINHLSLTFLVTSPQIVGKRHCRLLSLPDQPCNLGKAT